MKVITPRAAIDKVNHFNWPIYKQTIFLVLIASVISFIVAWILKGETAKNGGIRLTVSGWARAHGYCYGGRSSSICRQASARTDGEQLLTLDQSYLELLKIPYYLLNPVEVPQLVIDIDFKSFQKILKKREKAMKKGKLVTSKKDFVPAKIRHEGKSTKVKLRLKGDLLDHLKGDKWSFRVKVKGKDQIYGMRVFSIQSPLVRGFQGVALFYTSLKYYGLLAPRYKLVNAIINGNDLGIMSIEEHFSKEMLESSGRKESVIIRFDESLVWAARDGAQNTGLGGHFDNYHLADIDGFGSKKIAKSDRLTSNYQVAVGLLRAFENGTLRASDVFDVELMARYIAVSEMWGSWHSFSWRNLRYYFNPITSRLEPIGNDPDIQNRSAPSSNRAQGEPITSVMRTALLNDPKIFAAFKKAVHRINEDMISGDLLKKLKKREDELLPVLKKEFFLLLPFDRTELKQRIDLLERYSKDDLERLYQVHYQYPALLKAYSVSDNGTAIIELANITPSPVEVLSLRWVADKDGNKTVDVKLSGHTSLPLQLPATPRLSKPVYIKIPFDNQQKFKKDLHLEVIARVSGTLETVATKVVPYYSELASNPVPVSTLQQQVSIHKPYLEAVESTGILRVKPGRWKVEDMIVVPKDAVLEMNPATMLQFASDAGIISHGSLRFNGDKNSPVILQGVNDNSWQGIVVLNAAASSLSNILIKNTSGISLPDWSMTGGVTFYHSDVTIKHSTFEGSRGEDALNIVHSNFSLVNVIFSKSASDAFDADFSTGKVSGGLFQDIGLAGGGDAIDVSGSKIFVEGTRFIDIDDKAVSVGEQSQLQATGLDIDGTGTGAASKDASVLQISASKIYNAHNAGLMAYIKKPEFGPGRISASAIDFGSGFEKTRVQRGSYITIDGERMEEVDIDVKDMYKTFMKPGLR
jgi:hypothetical protein